MRENSNILPIIILNWNSFEDTKECIDSIIDSNPKNIKIYLLDNGSNIENVNALKSTYQNHKFIELRFYQENHGFTKAHNIILKELLTKNYKYVFLLNNDTIIEKSTLINLQAILENDDIDMISCKMINYWDRQKMDNAGHRLMTSGEILPKFHNVFENKVSESFQNVGPCAGAGIYSLKMLKDIGLFDEYFKTGYEDAEIGLRAIIAGYNSQFIPEIIVYHKMGNSIKKVFNYDFSVKIQSNVFYTFIKLAHWQVLIIRLIPFILRFLFIGFVDLISFKTRHLKVQFHALYIIMIKDFKKSWKARKQVKTIKRISWRDLLIMQDSNLKRDYTNFIKYIIKGEKSYFEKF